MSADGPRRLIPCARVSTRDQGDHGTSLDTQTEACQRYIARLSGVALAPVAEDVSGVVPMSERPGGAQVLRQLEHGEADGTLVIIEEEARVVRVIYRWYTHGPNEDEARTEFKAGQPLHVNQIATLLYLLKVPTRMDTQGGEHPSRKALPCEWRPSVVHSILMDRVYVGEWTYGKGGETPVTVPVPRIIEDSQFQEVQMRLALNKKFSPRNRKHHYLLSARVRCACGCSMFGRSVHAGGKPTGNLNLYYVCSSQTMPRSYVERCNAPHFNAAKMDDQVWQDVRAMLLDPASLVQGVRERQSNATQRNAVAAARVERIDREMAGLDESSKRLLSAFVRGVFTQEETEAQKQEIEAQRQRLRAEKAELIAQMGAVVSDADLSEFEATCDDIAEGLDLADFETRRRYLSWLDAQIILRVVDGKRESETTISVNGLRVPLPRAVSPHAG